jgi:glycosyltransferase involved in cell wall biosynthesis
MNHDRRPVAGDRRPGSGDPAGGTPRWSVVIPACNEERSLPLTLALLRRHLPLLPGGSEIVVVDNGSVDRTAAIARAAGAVVVVEPVPGIGRARNAGARVARGDLLFFLDADCRVGRELLAAVAARMADARCLAGSAAQIPDRPLPLFDAAGFKVWNALAAATGRFSGHCLVMRRTLWRRLKGFDESLYALEAADLGLRATRWCRRHGGHTFLLRRPRLPFDCRKLPRLGWCRRLALAAVLLAGPLATRRRGLCGFWYDRSWWR